MRQASRTILTLTAGALVFSPAAHAAAPANDAFAAAESVTAAPGSPTTVTGTNREATREPGEPFHGHRFGGRSVWYAWTAQAGTRVTIATCGSDFDTQLAVYSGESLTALDRVASSGDSHACADRTRSSTSFHPLAGRTYRVAVEGRRGATGSVALAISQATPPPPPRPPAPPPPPPPTIDVADVAVEEPGGRPLAATLTVSLSAPSALPVSVGYATNQISARLRDFDPAAGTLSFAPGQTTKQVTVLVKPDAVSERAEQIAVDLHDPVNAELGRGFGILTILDSDLPLAGKCGPAFCMEPGMGPVRMSHTGDGAELVRTVPITRAGKRRVAMRLGPAQLGPVGAGDRVEASGEVEVSVTCLEAMKKCVGSRYRYSPLVSGTLVLGRKKGGTGGIVLDRERLRCSQALPHRNHHCVLVFGPKAETLPRGCGSCHLKLVLAARHPAARRGNRLVVGSDATSGVQQDRARLNATVVSPGADAPKLAVERRPARRAIRVSSRSADDLPEHVVYSLRLDDLREHEQLAIDARALIRTSHLPYGTFLGADLVLSEGSGAARGGGKQHDRVPLSEKNGFNCTRGASAHDNPCVVRKVGLLRVKRSIGGPAYVNLVVQAAARFGGGWHRGQKARVLPRGAIRVKRYGPMGWLRLTPVP